MIKCFHDYPTVVEESSAFMFHSNMKDLKDSTVGNTVLHVRSSQRKSRLMQCQAMGQSPTPMPLSHIVSLLLYQTLMPEYRAMPVPIGKQYLSTDLFMRFSWPISASQSSLEACTIFSLMDTVRDPARSRPCHLSSFISNT